MWNGKRGVCDSISKAHDISILTGSLSFPRKKKKTGLLSCTGAWSPMAYNKNLLKVKPPTIAN